MIYGSDEFDDLLKGILRGDRHACYKECCEHAEEMSWHFYGVTPTELLTRVRPNEDPAITAYRIENYEPITKAAADKSINIVSKIFNPNLYSIRWKDKNDKSEELKDYTLDYYPEYNSVVTFTKDVLLRKMLADPNALAVVTMEEISEYQNDRNKPVIKIYGSSEIWHEDEDGYLIHRKTETEKGAEIFYFDYFDREQIVSFSTWIKNGELIQIEESLYVHDFGEIPAWKLRGISESMDSGEIIYKSFFSSAAPYWNNAIVHESDVFAAYIRHLFPQRYELSEACSYKMELGGQLYPCRSGQIKYPDGLASCPHCKGSGYAPIGPYGVYKYTKDKLTESGPLGVDPVGYITVPTDATKMLEDRAQRMLDKGMWAINMDVEDKVGENQSGVAKVIDRSAQFDTLYNISGVVFDVHLPNFFYYAAKFMFGVELKSAGKESDVIDNTLPEINKPTHFDIGSVSELINNFKAAKDSGLDPNFLQNKQIEILSRDLTTNPDLKMFNILLLELDPLPGMAQVDVDRNVTRGYVTKVDAIIHFNLKSFCERAISESKNFLTIPIKDQKAKLQEYGAELEAKTKPILEVVI